MCVSVGLVSGTLPPATRSLRQRVVLSQRLTGESSSTGAPQTFMFRASSPGGTRAPQPRFSTRDMPKVRDEPQGALTWRFSVLLPGHCTMGLAQEKAAEPRLVAHVSRGQARGLGPCNEHVTGGFDQELACQAANHSDGNPA